MMRMTDHGHTQFVCVRLTRIIFIKPKTMTGLRLLTDLIILKAMVTILSLLSQSLLQFSTLHATYRRDLIWMKIWNIIS
jgi:hypothetical protein